MATIDLQKMYHDPSKNKKFALRFKDGSWFRVDATRLPDTLKFNTCAIIDLDGEVIKRAIPQSEIDYVVNLHNSGFAIPCLELLHAYESKIYTCTVLASRTNLILIHSHGCSIVDINKARAAYFGGSVAGSAFDERIAELVRIQEECEVEKTRLVNLRRAELRTSALNITPILQASLLPWDELRKDFGYIGESLHVCKLCADTGRPESGVDKFILTDGLIPTLGGEIDQVYVRCLNTECPNSAGTIFPGEEDKPDWLMCASENTPVKNS